MVYTIFALKANKVKGFQRYITDEFNPYFLAIIVSISAYSSEEIKPLFSICFTFDIVVLYRRMVLRLVFDDLWENVEADVKKWAAGKSTTEKRLENLRNSIAETELEIQKILMERIEDKQNSDMYNKMIETRRDDIEKFKKEISEIENLDKTIKERKSTLKHSIELLDDIIADNNISNANLHLMFDKIVIEETDEGLNLDLRLKSPFISKKKESLLKKYMIVDNEVLSVGA